MFLQVRIYMYMCCTCKNHIVCYTLVGVVATAHFMCTYVQVMMDNSTALSR